jgi:hypothetical protein
MKKDEVSIGTWPTPEKPLIEKLKVNFPSDKRFFSLMLETDKYQEKYCEELEKKIRDLINKFCERYEGQKDIFCKDEFNDSVHDLCELFKIYRERCCTGCCGPKDEGWEKLIESISLTFRYLNPSGSVSGTGIDITVLEDPMTEYQSNTCQTLREELMDLVTRICEYRKEPLCPDNKLTRALKRLCDVYPTYRKNCC